MGIIEKMRLDGKKGFVTGAARGIGKCTATAFAEAGADVAIVDLDFEEAQKTAKELAEKTGRKVIAIKTDCTRKIHACTWRRIYHQYSFHVSPHCKCTAATVCVQCIQSRSYPAYQIPGN